MTASDPETQGLLHPGQENLNYNTTAATPSDGAAIHRDELDRDATHGEHYDEVPQEKRQLGTFSAIFIVFNRIIGTGIYATPSNILRSAGSVGVALIMWLVGTFIAATGTAVYIEFGTALPRSGGEKNYLEFIYRRPRFFATCVYSIYGVLGNLSAGNSLVFGEYLMHALSLPATQFNIRLTAILCLTFNVMMHGVFYKAGLRLQNLLGLFKLFFLSAIALSGILCLTGVPGFQVREGYEKPNNYQWDKFWEGSGTGANSFVTGLYNVFWSFVGYNAANYALSETKDPVRTITRAAPIAVFSAASVYLLVNIAYFSVVSKSDILGSRQIIAALYFRNLFGDTAGRALSAFISLSMLGNLLSGQFTQGRVIQEIGREGILPYSPFFASNEPFGAPLAGLLTQYLLSCVFILGPPPGDAYLFLINLSSMSNAWINVCVAVGLVLLHTPSYKAWGWNPPYAAPKIVMILFLISNLLLVTVPLIPPLPGRRVYEHLPYWSHVLAAFLISLIGALYWYIWSKYLPWRYSYRLERQWVRHDDGVSRYVFRKLPLRE